MVELCWVSSFPQIHSAPCAGPWGMTSIDYNYGLAPLLSGFWLGSANGESQEIKESGGC